MVIPVVLEQHAEAAAFHWLLRDAAVHAPHYTLDDLANSTPASMPILMGYVLPVTPVGRLVRNNSGGKQRERSLSQPF